MSDQNAFGLPTPPPPPAVQRPESEEPPILKHTDQLAELEAQLEATNPPQFLPVPWRFRHRTQLRLLMARMASLLDDEGRLVIDEDDLATVQAPLELVSDVDDFFETVAVDPKAYATWSASLAEPERTLLSLLGKYGRAVGESSPSANDSTPTASS